MVQCTQQYSLVWSATQPDTFIIRAICMYQSIAGSRRARGVLKQKERPFFGGGEGEGPWVGTPGLSVVTHICSLLAQKRAHSNVQLFVTWCTHAKRWRGDLNKVATTCAINHNNQTHNSCVRLRTLCTAQPTSLLLLLLLPTAATAPYCYCCLLCLLRSCQAAAAAVC